MVNIVSCVRAADDTHMSLYIRTGHNKRQGPTNRFVLISRQLLSSPLSAQHLLRWIDSQAGRKAGRRQVKQDVLLNNHVHSIVAPIQTQPNPSILPRHKSATAATFSSPINFLLYLEINPLTDSPASCLLPHHLPPTTILHNSARFPEEQHYTATNCDWMEGVGHTHIMEEPQKLN